MRRASLSAPRWHRQGGHTLWEMLLVLALLGAVTAIVAPAVGTRAQAKLDGVTLATAEVVSVLAQARSMALERGTSVDVMFDPRAARVWIIGGDRGDRRILATTTLRLAPGTVLTANEPRVRFTFHPAGTADGGPVVISGMGGGQRVTVDPWSGVADAAKR